MDIAEPRSPRTRKKPGCSRRTRACVRRPVRARAYGVSPPPIPRLSFREIGNQGLPSGQSPIAAFARNRRSSCDAHGVGRATPYLTVRSIARDSTGRRATRWFAGALGVRNPRLCSLLHRSSMLSKIYRVASSGVSAGLDSSSPETVGYLSA